VTCGNVTNRRLHEVFLKTFAEAQGLLSAGQAIVEVG
jgi:predicted nuclease of predicted toxin-antitoxin system